MTKPTLLILAAGLSSRYKLGLKQIDTFGPNGETLLDYAIYDAIQAGFGKAVFVIRKEIKDDFEKFVTSKYDNLIDYDIVFQEVGDLPNGLELKTNREKPWGTGHAVWVARNKVKEPFAVINADDFYGSESYKTMKAFLTGKTSAEVGKYALIGFSLKNTLSENGSVSRGICKVKDGFLKDIDERTNIRLQEGRPVYLDDKNILKGLDPNSVVSMNMWGFTPDLFKRFEYSFQHFLNQNMHNNKSEFFLPTWIKEELLSPSIGVEVLSTTSQWIGVTNPEDKAFVKNRLKIYAEEGIYPSPLF